MKLCLGRSERIQILLKFAHWGFHVGLLNTKYFALVVERFDAAMKLFVLGDDKLIFASKMIVLPAELFEVALKSLDLDGRRWMLLLVSRFHHSTAIVFFERCVDPRVSSIDNSVYNVVDPDIFCFT